MLIKIRSRDESHVLDLQLDPTVAKLTSEISRVSKNRSGETPQIKYDFPPKTLHLEQFDPKTLLCNLPINLERMQLLVCTEDGDRDIVDSPVPIEEQPKTAELETEKFPPPPYIPYTSTDITAESSSIAAARTHNLGSSKPGSVSAAEIDDASLQLALSIQKNDLDEFERTRKGKGKADDISSSDDLVAVNSFREIIEEFLTIQNDHRMAEALAQANDDDIREIEALQRDEDVAEQDHRLAVVLQHEEDTASSATNQWNTQSSGSGATESTTEQSYAAESSGVAHSSSFEPEKIAIDCAGCGKDLNCQPMPCGHYYCVECLQTLVKYSLSDDELFPPRCCKQEITLTVFELCLSEVELKRYQDKAEEILSKSRLYCHRPNCGAFIPKENIKDKIGTCHRCSPVATTCVYCKGKGHGGDCPSDAELHKTLELGAKEGWQRCRRCYHLVELRYGCMHITCRCGSQWCYNCSKKWRTCSCAEFDMGKNRTVEDLSIHLELEGN